MAEGDRVARQVAGLDVPLDADIFMRTLVRELANVLRDIVGVDQASGFISVAGQTMGRRIDEQYRAALRVPSLSREQVAAVLVDLKRRIGGDFELVEQDDRRIVLGARRCPFGDQVVGQRIMCMMTSNVFGTLAAENLGYAKVQLRETLAQRMPGCRVVIHLEMGGDADAVDGREYFRTVQEAE